MYIPTIIAENPEANGITSKGVFCDIILDTRKMIIIETITRSKKNICCIVGSILLLTSKSRIILLMYRGIRNTFTNSKVKGSIIPKIEK